MILMAMAIGAGIGALAGGLVYGAKVALSKETNFSWKDLGAHVAGGVVGGGLFPPILAGLAAVGLPTAAAYIVAGGLAWGGLWTAAQDATSWALGRTRGMGAPSHYLKATAIGLLATALLFPLASRAVGPGMQVARHAGTVESFLVPSRSAVAGNILKSEAEFLAFGTLSEAANAGLTATGRALATRGTNRLLTTAATEAGVETGIQASNRLLQQGGRQVVDGAGRVLPPLVVAGVNEAQRDAVEEVAPAATTATPQATSSFGAFAERIHQRHVEDVAPLQPAAEDGLAEVLRSLHDEASASSKE